MAKGLPVAGSVLLVTGGSGGIGHALARSARGRGATVVTADLPGTGADVDVDVADRTSVAAAVDATVEGHGRVDIVVANAGIAVGGLVEDMTADDWDRTLAVNLHGAVHTVEVAYPHLISPGRDRRGAIVLVASLAGLLPAPLLVPYGVSKAAIVALASGLRVEGARRGVGVTVVCPGPVETAMLDEPASTSGVQLRRHITRAAGRPITPERLADAILRAVEHNRPMVAPGQAALLRRVAGIAPGTVSAVVGLQLKRELQVARRG